ncbi:MAG: methyltransferase domain-containing protein [Pirellulales bacterium]
MLETIVCCPVTRSPLIRDGNWLTSAEGRRYPVVHGVPVLLAPKEDRTLWVADASITAGQENAEDPWQLETIGVSSEELVELRKQVANFNPDKDTDPVISFLIGATAGYLYVDKIGSLQSIPIPDIRLPKSDGNLLLDIGCNWGRWSISAGRLGYQVVGMDPSLGAVLAAKRLAQKMNLPNVQFVVGDATQLPFRNAVFDQIFSYSVIQHFSYEAAEAAINQAATVSKPGGRLYIQMPNTLGIRCLYHQARRGFKAASDFDVRYYTPTHLLRVFDRSFGPSRLEIDGFFGLGIQPSDLHMMPWKNRLIIRTSELLRSMGRVVTPLKLVADSLYVSSTRRT